MTLQDLAVRWTPRLLSVLRIMTGLLFFEHGTAKLFDFPAGAFPGGGHMDLTGVIGISALLEFFGGALIALGLFTRPVAFLLSGEMAVAYFLVHAPGNFFPLLNHGEGAILYCFIFLYLSAAGPGPWSLDRVRTATGQPV